MSVGAQWLNEITNFIENFVLQGMNLSTEKLYQDPKDGGLGMFNPKLCFKSLNCTWLKRCADLTRDCWRHILMDCAGDAGVSYIQENDAHELGPILRNIVSSFVFFRNSFGTVKNNLWAYTLLPVTTNIIYNIIKYKANINGMGPYCLILGP
jgi:hypothetical protein